MMNVARQLFRACIVATSLAVQAAPYSATFELSLGASNELCRQIEQEGRSRGSRLGWLQVLPPSGSVLRILSTDLASNLADDQKSATIFLGSFSRTRFDLDNDGIPDTVYGIHPRVRAWMADLYFMSPGASVDKQWATALDDATFIDTLSKSSEYSFPRSHAVCRGGTCRSSEDLSLVLDSFADAKGLPLRYGLRYLTTTPFQWRGSTYFLLDEAGYLNEFVAIVKPTRHKVPELECVFRRVR